MQSFQGLPRGGDHRWGGRRRENIGPARVAHELKLRVVADAIAAGACQAFAEGADDEVRLVQDAGFFHQPPPLFSQHPQGVRFVNEQKRAKMFFDLDDRFDPGPVPQHAVDALDDHQSPGRPRAQALQPLAQVVGIVVPEANNFGAA